MNKKQLDLMLAYIDGAIVLHSLRSSGRAWGADSDRQIVLVEHLRQSCGPVSQPAPVIDLDAAVSRFLGWKLPQDFSPDCGVSFKRESNYDHPEFGRTKFAPIGTNLLNAQQARAMLEYVLGFHKEG